MRSERIIACGRVYAALRAPKRLIGFLWARSAPARVGPFESSATDDGAWFADLVATGRAHACVQCRIHRADVLVGTGQGAIIARGRVRRDVSPSFSAHDQLLPA